MAKENIRSGLCVHLGRTDGQVETALVKEGLLVHALATDAAIVDAARKYLTSKHVYGRASVERAVNLASLPYADSLVNLVVVDDMESLLSGGCSLSEIERILAPGGVVLVGARDGKKSHAKWKRLLVKTGLRDRKTVEDSPGWFSAIKSRPPGMDQWTHRRHAADGNRLSGDTVVGIPNGPRWIAAPKFSDRS
ncbi:MAG: hypothetical protein O7B81_00250, partial [Gammaproteobacteria bacterium]|nr:hypothetical protein [Gammaproteobacteria bacterium]